MIGTSKLEYLFIRACILVLHWITPLSVLTCVAVFFARAHLLTLPIVLEVWLGLETAFYLLVYLPRRRYLQRPAVHPELVSREDRKKLFNRCLASIPDPEYYLSKWFMNSPPSEIKKENVKEFLRWAFLSTQDINEADEEEVTEYADATEKLLGRELAPGRGKAKCLRLTLDQVNMLHRSLIWYMCVFVVDSLTSVALYYWGFDYHRTPLKNFFSVFPYRPHNLLSRKTSPSETLTYWHRKHNSSTRLPILYIHGIGIGLYPYVKFFSEINGDDAQLAPGESVGIIAVEIMPVSFRITSQALQKQKMCTEINKVLEYHGWDKVVLISHSYGSVISTHLLHNPTTAPKIGPLMLIDPVTFLLHLPDVAYNFLCRKPEYANEHQLDYFASKDMGVAHTLSRRFFWSENIIWKEDFGNRPVTVVLSGRDLIVNTERVGAYLTDADEMSQQTGSWKSQEWKGTGVDILWFGELDHAQVFDKRSDRIALLRVLRKYCLAEKDV